MLLENGKILPIDKGMSFRHFGKDKLEMNFNPAAWQTTVYKSLLNWYQGELRAGRSPSNVDLQSIYPVIQRAQALAKNAPHIVENLLSEYAKSNPRIESEKGFSDAVIKRMKNLDKDFEKLYKEVTGKTFVFEGKPVAPAKPSDPVVPVGPAAPAEPSDPVGPVAPAIPGVPFKFTPQTE